MNKIWISLVTLLCAASWCQAQDAEKKIDDKAKEIMDGAAAFYQGLDSLQVDTAFNIKISSDNPALGGQDMDQSLVQQFNLKQPAQFSLISKGDAAMMGGADVYYDQGVGVVSIAGEGAIEVKDLENLTAFFESEKLGYQKEAEMNPFVDQNLAVSVLKSMVLQKPEEKWDDNVNQATYDGEEEVDGVKAHHLSIVAEQNVMGQSQDMKMDIWVQAGDQPLLLKVVPDMEAILKAMGGADNPMMADMKIEMSGSYDNWKVNEALADKLFTANLADVEKYDNFTDLMKALMGGGPGGEGGSPAEELVGQAAEDFELELLGGESFKLSDHKGEHVVILDFWATWCGPCVRALPELMAAADAYKEKDVILVAVNQREKTSRIEKFLKKEDWNLTVALDSDGRVGDAFRVQGIPQTVIVGKDGLVKKVHVGFAPGLKDQISSELDEILAEK